MIKAEDHIGLVVMLATKYRKHHKHLPIYDSEEYADGLLGLARAINGFKPDNGNSFGTYAWHCIRNSIIRGRKERARIKEIDLEEIEVEAKHQDYIESNYSLAVMDKPDDDDRLKRMKYIVREYVIMDRSLEDVGGDLGISRERARQIKNDALLLLKDGKM